MPKRKINNLGFVGIEPTPHESQGAQTTASLNGGGGGTVRGSTRHETKSDPRHNFETGQSIRNLQNDFRREIRQIFPENVRRVADDDVNTFGDNILRQKVVASVERQLRLDHFHQVGLK